jgi:hypothetical protein
MIKRMKNFAILSQVTGGPVMKNGLPSCVPDWHEPSTSTAPFLVVYELFWAGKWWKFSADLVRESTLRLNAAEFMKSWKSAPHTIILNVYEPQIFQSCCSIPSGAGERSGALHLNRSTNVKHHIITAVLSLSCIARSVAAAQLRSQGNM